MLFSDLALKFQELEETSSRSALVRILADLFHSASPDEIAPIAYLLQGRLAPTFVPLEMGMGVQSVAAAISKAYQTEKAAVLERFDRVGDLGTVAGEIIGEMSEASRATDTPDVREIFESLVEIARHAGSGSADMKVSAFAELLRSADPCSATFLCRIPLGTMRLGVGDLTILDAFSVAQVNDRSLRQRLERAYNETSDLGLIGTTLWTGGIDAVDALSVRAGNPVRPMLAERLPSAEAILDQLGRCSIENKYDGFRCQVHKVGGDVRIYSRSLEEMSAAFPEIVAGVVRQIEAETAIFEGEALAYNPLAEEYLPFQQTMRRRRKHGVDEAAAELPLRLFAFDALYVDGENVMPRTYTERRGTLGRLIAPGDTILVTEAHVVSEVHALTELFDTAITGGLEGIMAKKLDSPYQAGARSYNWVKLKRAQAGHLRDTVDCVIVGYMYGRGRRAGLGVGALLVAVYDPERDTFPAITKIGTGLSDQDWRSVVDRCAPYATDHRPARVESKLVPSVWVEPAVVVEILADEITRSPLYTAGAHGGEPGFALRFPRLVRFREDDKKPEDATTVTPRSSSSTTCREPRQLQAQVNHLRPERVGA
jgi:DNA ligase-1